MDIGQALKHKREREGLTLVDVAERTGLEKSTLSRIERGLGMSTEHRIRLSRYLNLPVSGIRGYARGASTIEIIQAAIYSDPHLSKSAAIRLSRMIQAALEASV